jgi:PAS domain S-box-containing protein
MSDPEGKLAPERLRCFSALIDQFPDMIHSVDAHGALVYVNCAASRLLGYTETELLGMNLRQLYPPEILDAVERGFREVRQSGAKQVESLFLAKDGTRIPVELRTLALHDEAGAFSSTFTVARDLRNLKEMQDQLLHAGRLAAIGELAAGVVHDLNNPLTAVIMASALMQGQAGTSAMPPEELREQTLLYCKTIEESAEVMKSLTTRLRDFARGVRDQHAPVDLFDPLRDALFILDHRLRSANIRVLCPVEKGRHGVLGDRNQLEQIFLNLFANACDAMADRPRRELRVDIRADDHAGTPGWTCEVADSGAGIPPAIREKVFESFFTTKPRGKGTGLGLSLAKTILKEHGGAIGLASEPGQGTTFRLWVPARPVPPAST